MSKNCGKEEKMKKTRKWFEKECHEKLQDRQKKRNILIQPETVENKENYSKS